jgi:hypothetical protein
MPLNILISFIIVYNLIIKAVIVLNSKKKDMEQNMNFDNEVLAYLSTRKDELMT